MKRNKRILTKLDHATDSIGDFIYTSKASIIVQVLLPIAILYVLYLPFDLISKLVLTLVENPAIEHQTIVEYYTKNTMLIIKLIYLISFAYIIISGIASVIKDMRNRNKIDSSNITSNFDNPFWTRTKTQFIKMGQFVLHSVKRVVRIVLKITIGVLTVVLLIWISSKIIDVLIESRIYG